jgi:hypothetical protein
MSADPAALPRALAALNAFDWGQDPASLRPIDEAVVACRGDRQLRSDIEGRLSAVLSGPTSRAAKEYACRQLCLMGTAACVPAVAAVLLEADLSHMARYALERIEAPEAAAALRAALPHATGSLQIGILSSLAARQDIASVAAIAAVLEAAIRAGNTILATAAADALGAMQDSAAEGMLGGVTVAADSPVAAAVSNARLAVAEALLAAKKPADALAIYRSLAAAAAGRADSRMVELAATRGMVACAEAMAS